MNPVAEHVNPLPKLGQLFAHPVEFLPPGSQLGPRGGEPGGVGPGGVGPGGPLA